MCQFTACPLRSTNNNKSTLGWMELGHHHHLLHRGNHVRSVTFVPLHSSPHFLSIHSSSPPRRAAQNCGNKDRCKDEGIASSCSFIPPNPSSSTDSIVVSSFFLVVVVFPAATASAIPAPIIKFRTVPGEDHEDSDNNNNSSSI